MGTSPHPEARIVPLADWVRLHPAATAADRPRSSPRTVAGQRSEALAEALAERNRRWSNQVDAELARWRSGADVVVTGQQPGLLGGPLLSLVKACAVAAEVRKRRDDGREAVGFFWLATPDDDLPEMGWARANAGEEVLETREETWRRGQEMAAGAALGDACARLIRQLAERSLSQHGREALDLAAACYRPGNLLGEATGRFFARLLEGLGVVLVDAREPALLRAGGTVVTRILERLGDAWRILHEGQRTMEARGWSAALHLTPARLPVFRIRDNVRRRLASHDGSCPEDVLGELMSHPDRFVPNAWLRPLQQDAVLGTTVALLGGAEFAYHVQARELWPLAGVARPEWRLRPHVTVATSAERRLVSQLSLEPHELLARSAPRRLLPGRRVRNASARLRRALAQQVGRVREAAREEVPALGGDLDATERKLEAALDWLDGRVERAETEAAEVEMRRWRKLRAFLRPEGRPQERHLSVIAPLLRLGLGWPRQLADALDPGHPGMHLLFWEEGGPW